VAGSDAELEELVRAVAARAGMQERRFDRGQPRICVKLPDGSRLTAVIAVSERACLSIRRHRYQRITLAPTHTGNASAVPSLVELGMLDPGLAELLAGCVRARRNLIVSGGMSAGKTTLLRALAAEIPPHEWLVTIEDALELGLDRDTGAHPHVFAWQSREANVEGEGEVDQAELVRWALRMSPDRVIVGEVRGVEALPMLNVMQQGCDGSMTTLHASSPTGAFMKLGSYALQSAERIPLEGTALMAATAIHLVVQLGVAADGRRAITEVAEVTGVAGIEVLTSRLYRPGVDGMAVPAGPPSRELAAALHAAGYQPDLPASVDGWGPR
jgi:Flp pilus assembly CpaF family ATPase